MRGLLSAASVISLFLGAWVQSSEAPLLNPCPSARPGVARGKGDQVRDWLYVEDHVRALQAVFERGEPGRTYNVGGHNERQNIEVVKTLCAILDELRPRADGKPYAEQMAQVADRPGHDKRYAIDASRIGEELGWTPAETFETGIAKTVDWYLANESWWRPLVAAKASERRGVA